jgi:protein-tyrosine phosphatase
VSEAPARVLMVCTGNICRSPMMERILQAAVEERGLQIAVTSAGTWVREGEPMTAFAAATLTDHGLDAGGFHATPLTETLITAADLVVTATREHRAHVVGLVPGAVRRTFTLLELARIASSAPRPPASDTAVVGEGVREAVAWAAQMRGSVPRPAGGGDDLDDPLGAPLEVYRERAETITGAVEQIVPFLFGPLPEGRAG